jgi:hypothetical protein
MRVEEREMGHLQEVAGGGGKMGSIRTGQKGICEDCKKREDCRFYKYLIAQYTCLVRCKGFVEATGKVDKDTGNNQ